LNRHKVVLGRSLLHP